MKYENVISKKTCNEERPYVNCFSQQGACLGPAPAKAPTEQDDRAAFEQAWDHFLLQHETNAIAANYFWQAALRYARGRG